MSAFVARSGIAWLAPDGEMPGYRRMTMANAAVLTDAMQRARTARDLTGLAASMGVSKRTLYRWRGATFHDVTVGCWTAVFVTRPHHLDGMPVQVTHWREVDR